MLSNWTPRITEAGALRRAEALKDGPPIKFTELAFGDQGYALPDDICTLTALKNERARAPIQDAQMLDNHNIAFNFLIETEHEFAVREVGLFLDDGTLYALAAHPDIALLSTSAAAHSVISIQINFNDLEVDEYEILTTGPPLELSHDRLWLALIIAQTHNVRNTLKIAQQVQALEKRA